MSSRSMAFLAAGVGFAVGSVLSGVLFIVFVRVTEGSTSVTITTRTTCTMQEFDAKVMAALGDAGCRVVAHEFNAALRGAVTGYSRAEGPFEIVYEPDSAGLVSVTTKVSGPDMQACTLFGDKVGVANVLPGCPPTTVPK